MPLLEKDNPYKKDSECPIQTEETAHQVAEKGQFATDKYGKPIIHFDAAAERKLRRKIDLFVMPTVAILFIFGFLDRSNIGNAKIAGIEKDLGLKGFDFNGLLSIYYISDVPMQVPMNIMCKIVKPGWWLPGISLGFGLCSLCMAFVHNFAQAAGVRLVLGCFEAGVLSGLTYYLSRWYRRSELTFRISLFVACGPLAAAFGGLLASAILKLDNFGSLHSWRMIFAIEGIITIALAFISFFTLTDRPETAIWLTQEEKDLAIARIKSERVSTTEVLETLEFPKMLRGMLNPVVLTTSFIFLLNSITAQGLGFFLPTIVHTIYPKKTVVEQQLYTVPPYIVGVFFTLVIPYISYRTDRRNICMVLASPFIIIGYTMFLASTNQNVRYAAVFLIAGFAFPYIALMNAQVSANVVSDTARSAAIGLTISIGTLGGLISSWSFVPKDAPNYHIGNGLNLAAAVSVLVVAAALELWMKWSNAKREERDVDGELEGLSVKEVQDLDWKHPGFRWKA